tara:strand:+ start:817 stop:990 length:174 start_codon:yes stop_codon:yes gene_type:complete
MKLQKVQVNGLALASELVKTLNKLGFDTSEMSLDDLVILNNRFKSTISEFFNMTIEG